MIERYFLAEIRANVRQNAPAFWALQAGRRPENRYRAIRANPVGSTKYDKRLSILIGNLFLYLTNYLTENKESESQHFSVKNGRRTGQCRTCIKPNCSAKVSLVYSAYQIGHSGSAIPGRHHLILQMPDNGLVRNSAKVDLCHLEVRRSSWALLFLRLTGCGHVPQKVCVTRSSIAGASA